MKLFEYEVKEAFKRLRIPVPKGFLASTPKEAGEAATQIGKPVVLKAQVLVGGRGKAGGVLTAEVPEAEEKAASLLGSKIKGLKVEKLLVEEKVEVSSELYMGITIDTEVGKPILMVSSEGGIEIEEVADRFPEKIATFHVDIFQGLRGYEARKIVKQIGLKGGLLPIGGDILQKLYTVFREYDAELVEINPLTVTANGKLTALDAKLNVDDHSLHRHTEIDPLRPDRFDNLLELEGRRRGVNYVDLDGNVALMGNGAGLTMTLMDMVVAEGISPACFLDTGGGVSRERMRNALELLIMKAEGNPNVKAILFNVNLQITLPEDVAHGILDAVEARKPNLLMLGVIRGTGAERAFKILEKKPVKLCRDAKEAKSLLVSQLGR